MSIRDTLNDHKWNRQDLDAIELLVVHRGAPNDQRVIPGSQIESIHAGGVMVFSALSLDGLHFLPYHRVLELRAQAGGDT